MKNQLLQTIGAFPNLRLLVIGEASTDIDLTGDSNRVAREAPVPIVQVGRVHRVPGRASNAAVNAAQLGAETTFLSVVGDDSEGKQLRHILREKGVNTRYMLTDPQRETQTIQRVIANDHLLVRFDCGTTDGLSDTTEKQLIKSLNRLYPSADAVLVSDYGYGILSERVLQALQELQQTHPKPLIVDSKYLDKYAKVRPTMVKPNYQEALTLLGITQPAPAGKRADQIMQHYRQLLHITGSKYAAVTLDTEGSIVLNKVSERHHRTYGRPVANSRAIGAGDTYSAALALALAAQAPVNTAVQIAQAAATVVVQKSGVATCARNELLQYFSADPKYVKDYRKLQKLVEQMKAEGRRIVFTNGCFDILHSGHVSYLDQAKAQGDVLIVGLNSDSSVKRLKGAGRPINTLDDRVRTLAGLQSVDVITSFEEDTPMSLLEIVRPDVFVKGGDYTRETLPEVPLVESMGGRVAIMPFVQDRSTTSVISRIRSLTENIIGGETDAAASSLGTMQ